MVGLEGNCSAQVPVRLYRNAVRWLECPLRIVGWRDQNYDVRMQFDAGRTQAQIVGEGIPGRQEGVDEEWNLYSVSGSLSNPADTGFVAGGEGLQWNFEFARRWKYYERYFIFPIHILVLFAYTSELLPT